MRTNSSNNITVVVPALNEEKGIQTTLEELMRLDVKEIIVVDGGSLDGTPEIAERIGARVFVEKGHGYGRAVLRGLQEAKGDFVVFIDADDSYDPNEIGKLVNILKGNVDVGAVIGSRTNFRKSIVVKFLNYTFRLFFGGLTSDVVSSFFAIRKNIMTDLVLNSLDFSLPIEIRAKLLRKGYTIIEVPVVYRPRLGEKKFKLSYGFSLLRRIIGLRF